MRAIKFGATAAAPVAFFAISASSAGAAVSEVTLCKSAKTVCPAGSVYKSGTVIKGQIGTFEMLGSLMVVCKPTLSATSGESSEGGKALAITITELSFAGCTGCKVVTATGLPYKATLKYVAGGTGNGELTTPMSFQLKECAFGASCVYQSGAASFQVLGGEPAELAIEEGELGGEFTRVEGSAFVCSSPLTFGAGLGLKTAPIAEPSPLFVAPERE
jgi:hypothetical protein